MSDGTDAICNGLQLAAVAQKPTCVAVTDMCYRHVMRNVAENIQVHLLVKEYKDTTIQDIGLLHRIPYLFQVLTHELYAP